MHADLLFATRIGSLAQTGQEMFTVRGVFQQGAVFFSPAGDMLYLTTTEQRGPFHLSVPHLSPWLARLEAGDTLEAQGNLVRIPRLGLIISLQGAVRWPGYTAQALRSRAATLFALGRMAEVVNRLELPPGCLWRAMNGHEEEETRRTQPPVMQRLAACMADLHSGLRKGDLRQALQAAGDMLGLGGGLTPAGDDVLCGTLAVIFDLGSTGALPAAWLSDFSGTISTWGRGRTSLLSAALLSAAARGEVNAALDEVKANLLEGSPPPESALRSLLQVGHTSGLDGLAGVRLALSAFLDGEGRL